MNNQSTKRRMAGRGLIAAALVSLPLTATVTYADSNTFEEVFADVPAPPAPPVPPSAAVAPAAPTAPAMLVQVAPEAPEAPDAVSSADMLSAGKCMSMASTVTTKRIAK